MKTECILIRERQSISRKFHGYPIEGAGEFEGAKMRFQDEEEKGIVQWLLQSTV